MSKKASSDEIWLRQPGESEKAYAAFKVYLELGEARTITATGKKVGKNRSFIDSLCSKFDWKNRARAYDNFVMFFDTVNKRKENEKRLKRLGRMGDKLLAIGASLLKVADPTKLSHKEAIAYMQLALKFAEASRDMFVLREAERTRADIKILRIETIQSGKTGFVGSSNFNEAISGAAADVWTDESSGADKGDENDDI